MTTIQWLLVGGPARGGTTVLAETLNTHPHVGLFVEYGLQNLVNHIDQLFKRHDVAQSVHIGLGNSPPDDYLERHLSSQFQRSGPIHGSDRVDDGSARLPIRRLHFDAIAHGIFSVVFPGRELWVIGDKWPLYANDIDLDRVLALIPTLKLLHIVRRPKDVVRSSLRRAELGAHGADMWHISNLLHACQEFILDWEATLRVKERLGSAMMLVKYEDLVSDASDRVMEDIASFIGVEPLFRNLFVAEDSQKSESGDVALDEVLEGTFAAIMAVWNRHPADELLRLFPRLGLACHAGSWIEMMRGSSGAHYFKSGIHHPEELGAWTNGRTTVLGASPLGLERIRALDLAYSCNYEPGRQIEYEIFVNGERIGAVSERPDSWGTVYERSFDLPEKLQSVRPLEIKICHLDPPPGREDSLMLRQFRFR